MNEIDAFIQFKHILNSLNPYSISLGLKRIQSCLEMLNNPQLKFKTIIIGGTNGKGTLAQLMADAFIYKGFMVGIYTSPNIIQINERIKINNKPLRYKELLTESKKIYPFSIKYNLTYFEFLTVLAYEIFKKYSVDLAVLEVGMGGEFDATNTTKPIMSILTSISLDHIDHLGKNKEEIAQTKCKIIKNIGVIGKNEKSVIETIKNTLKDKKLFFVNKDYLIKAQHLKTYMMGDVFKENLATAMLAIDKLNEIYNFDLQYTPLKNCYWPARLEIIKSRYSLFIIDGAHNYDSFLKFREFYKKFDNKILIFAILKQKEWHDIIKMVEDDFKLIKLPKIKNKLAVEPREIKNYLIKTNYRGKIELFSSTNETINSALNMNANYIIAGSLYLAGEAKACPLNDSFIL